jgi:hypothetical protein
MTDLIPRETGLPVARELAEMLLTQSDLANSLASLKLWVEGYAPKGDPDQRTTAIRGSLFRDAITQFVGCFDSKNAFPLIVETVFPEVEGIGPYFRWLRDLRNSYTAHRHGSARQCVIGALVDPVSGAYLGRGQLFTIYAGPGEEGHAPLISLIEMAIRFVDTRIAALTEQFDREAGAIAPADLLKLPPAGVQPQGPQSMSKSRGDVRKGMEREHDAKS